jgi:hypothetical protein
MSRAGRATRSALACQFLPWEIALPQLRVFVSSTAYDLGLVRGQLRTFIRSLGHEAVMSEFSGVLYDPGQHTHQACIQELSTCDMVVLVIGGRWGSPARPEFLTGLTPEVIDDPSGLLTNMLDEGNISVTQLEALQAFRLGIPMFVFVDESVRSEARMYEANAALADSGAMTFPTVGDAAVARYIFKFLDYVSSRTTGNAVVDFRQIEDIQSHLRNQWSAFLQRLLRETRDAEQDRNLTESLAERLDDMKAAILSSIQSPDARNVAAGVLNYRMLCNVLAGIRMPRSEYGSTDGVPFIDLLKRNGFRHLVPLGEPSAQNRAAGISHTLLVFDDRIVELRMSESRFMDLSREWDSFSDLPPEERSLIFDSIMSDRPLRGIVLREVPMTPVISEALEVGVINDVDTWRALTRVEQPETRSQEHAAVDLRSTSRLGTEGR